MKKRLAVFALFAALSGCIVILGKSVPAWEGMWQRTASYEQKIEENGKDRKKEQQETEEAAAETETEENELFLYAQSAVLIDGDSGRVLYGKNEKEIRPMASTTKIMTCILALESGKMEDVVTVSKQAAAQPEVHLGVSSGRRFYMKDLLYSLMLESHNDSAVAIAEHLGGTVEGFAALMNQKARDIGCAHTFFITPNGLDKKGTDREGKERIHSTTASDLARIMRYCVFQSPAREEFLEITKTSAYTFSDADGKGTYSCVNHNAFLTMMKGALSGKTGFTGEAGYCYVGAVKDGERNFIIALLGCGWPPHKTYKWADARTLFQYGLDSYQYRNVWQDREIPDIPVENGIPEDGDISRGMTVKAEIKKIDDGKKGGEGELYLLLRQEEEPEIIVHMEEKLKAPVKKGDRAGWVEYRLKGQTVAAYPIVLKEGAERISFLWCLEKTGELYLE